MKLTEEELIRELREERPEVDPEFGRKLDEWAEAGFPRGKRPGPSRDGLRSRIAQGIEGGREKFANTPPRRLIAPVGAAATLVVVVGIAISQSGGGEDALTVAEPDMETLQAPGGSGEAPAATDAGVPEAQRAAEDSDVTDAGAPPNGAGEPGPAGRKVAQQVDLRLASERDEVQSVADGVNSVVNKYRGFVVDSSVETGDSELGAGANFRMRIPARNLQAALAEMSELAHVESRTEGTRDITARFLSAEDRIEEGRARRESLLKQLADADTRSEKNSIEAQLRIVNSELSAARSDLAGARERVQLVPVTVSIVAEDGVGDGEWGVDEALEDAGGVLSALAGALLVGGAVLVPLVLVAGAAYAINRRRIRAARDRALD
jgi:hypothetical protein